MQLLKYLQAQGLGSRKQCQWLIDNDCVAVNGGIRNDGKSEIDPAEVRTLHIDGEAVQASANHQVRTGHRGAGMAGQPFPSLTFISY